MVFVDTSAWVDYLKGKASPQTKRLDVLLGRELVVTGELVVIECLRGFRGKRDHRIAQALFKRLRFEGMSGWELAIRSAKCIDSLYATAMVAA